MSIFAHSRPLGSTLSVLWLFAILNILFRDIHELTTASAINEILSGHVNGNPISEELLFGAAFAVELLLLGFLLSSLLKAPWARVLNLVLAPLAIVGVIFGAPSDLDDYFFAFVEICTFGLIFIIAWRWKSEDHSALVTGGYRAT
ncbi:MAG: DUF6326 family protein [Pseudomonadota bacterium]